MISPLYCWRRLLFLAFFGAAATAGPCCIELPWALANGSSNLLMQDELSPWMASLGWAVGTDSLDPLNGDQAYMLGRVTLSSEQNASVAGVHFLQPSDGSVESEPLIAVFSHWQTSLLAGVSTVTFAFDTPVELQHVRLRRSIDASARSSVRINSYRSGGVLVAQRVSLWSSALTDTLYEYSTTSAHEVTRVQVEFFGGSGYGGVHSLRACTTRALDASVCAAYCQSDADQCVPSASSTRSASITPSTTAAPTLGTSATGSPSNTGSSTSSASVSNTLTPSTTPTPSASESPSLSATQTPSLSQSATQTPSASQSGSSGASASPSASASETPTGTPSASDTPTPSTSAAPSTSASASATLTPSQTPSISQSASRGASASASPLPTVLECDTGLHGVCAVGQYVRRADGTVVCQVVHAPIAEVCNGQDDDCDGQVDNGLPTLHCGVGECRRSVYSCALGVVVDACVPGEPHPEVCNQSDDDCNSLVDEQNVCGDQVFVSRNAAAVPLAYCLDATHCTAHWHVLTAELPLVDTQWQVELVDNSVEQQRPVSLAGANYTLSHLDAVRFNASNCGAGATLRIRTLPSSNGPASRALPRLLPWQQAAVTELDAPPCDGAAYVEVRFAGDPGVEPLVPLVDSCVLQRDELCSVSFGYYNPNAGVVVVQQHANNMSADASAALGAVLTRAQYQSVTFLPGRVYGAITVQSQCATPNAAHWYVQWQLGALLARVTLAQRCSATATNK